MRMSEVIWHVITYLAQPGEVLVQQEAPPHLHVVAEELGNEVS